MVDLFAGIAVSDFARAVEWFERLVGEPATFEAHETERVWTLAENRSVYLVLQPEHAGHSLVTWFADDFDAFLASARSRGITPDTVETYENGGRKATYRDPDGNEVGIGGGPVTR
jgi:predicted enzyme related to lactoylglutathione lyase